MPIEAGKFKQLVIENTLRGCQLFAGLPAADITAVASFLIPKQFAKGEYLFHHGDQSLGFYIVQKGSINVHRTSASGKEQVIHVFRPIESFAEASLPDGRYPVDARAIESSTVLFVPKNDFVELVRRRPELALRMFASMSQHLRVLVGLLEDLTLKDIETRLANWLLKSMSTPGDEQRGGNQTRSHQARAGGGNGNHQRNVVANAGEVSGSQASARQRQCHYHHRTGRIAKALTSAPRGILKKIRRAAPNPEFTRFRYEIDCVLI